MSVANQMLERSLLAACPSLPLLKVGTPQIALPTVCAKNLHRVKQEQEALQIMTTVNGAVSHAQQEKLAPQDQHLALFAPRAKLLQHEE